MTAPAVQLPLEGFAPGVYEDLPAEEYHAQTSSLSSSGARKLLSPNCPARFKWDLDNPQPSKKTFEFGTAAHQMVLGSGPQLVVVDRKRWDTDLVKAELAEIRERGDIPLKKAELEAVEAMAKAIREHPLAAALLDPEYGKAEQSLFWTDPDTGVQCRARLDWLPVPEDGRMLVAEYKSTVNASVKKFEKAVLTYRYDQQAEWNSAGIQALKLAADVQFMFIAQEKTPPFLVNVIRLDSMWLVMAADRNRRAREIYKRCTETGIWPGYSSDVEVAMSPSWLEIDHEREYRP